MSKKRRKRQQEAKPEKRSAPTRQSIFTIADAMPRDLLSRLKGAPSIPVSSKSALKTHAPNTHSKSQQENPKPSGQKLVTSRVSSKAPTPNTGTHRREAPSTASSPTARVPKKVQPATTSELGLADIAKKAVSKRPRSIRTTRGGLVGPKADATISDNNHRSELRRSQYSEIILNSFRHLGSKRLHINLGIDLGTSFSKVVWRGSDKAYPICFGDDPCKLENYLVPSIVVFDGKSIMPAMGPTNLSNGDSIPNFKMCLACVSVPNGVCQPSTCTLSNWWRAINLLPEPVQLVNAFFLAQLVSRSRTLVHQELEKRGVKNPAIQWSANLAVPEKYMDVSPTLDSFRKVLRTSWLMAAVFDRFGEISSVEEVIDCYWCAKEIADDDRELDCFVYPEVGAEVASVTMSRSAKEGLYAFVDVGGGTVDGSVFRFHRPRRGEAAQATYAASVIKAGAAHIEMSASSKLADQSIQWFKEMKEDGRKAAGLSVKTDSILDRPFEESLAEIKEEVRTELIQLFKAAHEKEKGVINWKDLQLVVGGGGATIASYVTAAREAFSLKGNVRKANLTEVRLDAPSDFEMGCLSRNVFHRFAVAYGLSFEEVNLPEIALAKDVKAQPPMPKREFVDPTRDD
jgi:hypothetical protein